MQTKEKLLNQFPNVCIEYDNNLNKKQKGYYERDSFDPDGYITLNSNYNAYILNGVLAEELGHHVTSYGNIMDNYSKKYNVESARQELRARRYGHKLIMSLEKLIECYKKGLCGSVYDICLYLEIDRSYLKEIINDYKSQFGLYIEIDGYRIEFEPLNIYKISKGAT